jgi:hypothetical protein
LSVPSIISLACSSRFTLACASEQFAWRFALPLELVFRFDLPPRVDAGHSRHSASLLRFCSVSVRWVQSEMSAIDLQAEVGALFNIPYVTSINGNKRYISADGLACLLAHPSFARVTSLELHDTCRADAKCAMLLKECISLTHIKFSGSGASMLLESLPHLSRLSSMVLYRSPPVNYQLFPIHQCTSLRSLSLNWLRPRSVAALLSSNMQHLTSLSLTAIDFSLGEEFLQLWTQCLAGLPRLTSLILIEMRKIDLLLSALFNQIPLLCSLSITACQLNPAYAELPSDELVESLLSRPTLHVTVTFRRWEAHLQWMGVAGYHGQRGDEEAANWRAVHQRLCRLVQMHSEAVSLQLLD